uniref:Uncharacterized protein n=1 Tax=Anguilla anguilla TaxID=7936 RepID=A0A0E9TVA3_ANGAN
MSTPRLRPASQNHTPFPKK